MNEPKTQFRGWRIPGPVPPGALAHQPAIEPGETLDALSGHFRVFQLENGHRFSTDDILTAWYGSTAAPTVSKVLDLGSGIGTVAMVAAWRLPSARFVTIEAQAHSVRLARKSAEWNGLASRFEIREGDFRDQAILLVDERFDLVLGSPPYFPRGSGVEGDHPQKIACRFELRGDIRDYCAVASRHLGPGGLFACVFPVDPDEQHERIRRSAAEAGLVIIRWRPVALREGNRPLLGLFAMMRAEDLPEWMRREPWTESPLSIRKADGSIHPEYSAIKLSFGFPP
jgi:tRNA1Val (adenine37-N6)-methyltransferase